MKLTIEGVRLYKHGSDHEDLEIEPHTGMDGDDDFVRVSIGEHETHVKRSDLVRALRLLQDAP